LPLIMWCPAEGVDLLSSLARTVPKDAVSPDMKVDLSQGRAFPADPGRKGGMKKYDERLNMHPEKDTIKYRKGPDDNKKYKGREDLFANQE